MVNIFDEHIKMEYERIKGQIFLRVQIVCEGSTNSDKIKFIYDDNLDNCFFFAGNPCPDPYVSPDNNFSLACDSVLLI